jgi:phosphoribosylpyrophosphate synthetase
MVFAGSGSRKLGQAIGDCLGVPLGQSECIQFDALGARFAMADKQRPDHSENPDILDIIGDVGGRTVLIVDDFTISAGKLCEVADALVSRGAGAVHAAVSQASSRPEPCSASKRAPSHPS